jgi:hypothetical protein
VIAVIAVNAMNGERHEQWVRLATRTVLRLPGVLLRSFSAITAFSALTALQRGFSVALAERRQ